MSFDIEDLVGDGRIGLTRAAQSWNRQVPFAAWARIKIRGAILDGIRRRNFTDATHHELHEQCDRPAPGDLEAETDRRRQAAAMKRALRGLPAILRSVVIAHQVREEPIEFIAARMGMNPRRVSALHSQAVHELRTLLKREGISRHRAIP